MTTAPVLKATPAATDVARTSFVVPTATISDTGGQAPTRYRVQVNTAASAIGAETVETMSWFGPTIGARAAGTAYFYRVAAYNAAGWGPWTLTWGEVTTLTDGPDDPAAPAVTDVTETSATLTWAAPATTVGAEIEEYLVRVCTGDDPGAFVQAFAVAADTLTQAVTGLVKATTYRAFVKARAATVASGWSAPGVFRTAGTSSTLFPQLNVAGVWRPVEVWQNVAGTWQRVALGLRVGTAWKTEVL